MLSKIKNIHENTIFILSQIHHETWFTNKLLYASSHLFLLPIFVYFFTNTSRIQSAIFSFLFINFIASIAFWYNPIKGSLVHKIDAVAARTSIITLLLYTLIFRKLSMFVLVTYILVVLTMFLFFFLSNTYSRKEWCCMEHILCHFMAHIFACFAIFFMII